MSDRKLIVMLKEPRAGRVKTRLGRNIGMTGAVWWFRHQTARLLRRIQSRKWQTILAVSPDREGLASRNWPAHLPKIPQGHGDLGDRMARLLRSTPGLTVIIGGDIPGVQPHHIEKAFRALAGNDAVFGPAPDGGYWLIGLNCTAPATFLQNVRWSSEHALQESILSLPGKRIAIVDTLQDVDTVADLSA